MLQNGFLINVHCKNLRTNKKALMDPKLLSLMVFEFHIHKLHNYKSSTILYSYLGIIINNFGNAVVAQLN